MLNVLTSQSVTPTRIPSTITTFFPDATVEQKLELLDEEYWPMASHGVQEPVFPNEYSPARQPAQGAVPSELLPASHAAQMPRPSPSNEYEPTTQVVQVSAFPSEYSPAVQFVQDEAPAEEAVPAGQELQDERDEEDFTIPAGHF